MSKLSGYNLLEQMMKPFMRTYALCRTFAGAAKAAQANMSHGNQSPEQAYDAPGHVPIGVEVLIFLRRQKLALPQQIVNNALDAGRFRL